MGSFKISSVNLIIAPKKSRYTKPVSYTHLDVYKRQVLGLFAYLTRRLVKRPAQGIVFEFSSGVWARGIRLVFKMPATVFL